MPLVRVSNGGTESPFPEGKFWAGTFRNIPATNSNRYESSYFNAIADCSQIKYIVFGATSGQSGTFTYRYTDADGTTTSKTGTRGQKIAVDKSQKFLHMGYGSNSTEFYVYFPTS